jgi:hypothetical protein
VTPEIGIWFDGTVGVPTAWALERFEIQPLP